MMGLAEKERTLAILKANITMDAPEKIEKEKNSKTALSEEKIGEVVKDLKEQYVDVRLRKTVYLPRKEAEEFFSFWKSGEKPFEEMIEEVTKGPCEVLVLESAEGGTVDKVVELLPGLLEKHGDIYVSASKWEAVRDIEYFFPYMDSLPVERTYAMMKPDVMEKGYREEILAEIQAKGLMIVGMKSQKLPVVQAEQLYAEHKGKPFYDGLMKFMCGEAGITAMCLEGNGAIEKWRLMCGPTNSDAAKRAAPDSLRARFGTDGTCNAVHGSDSTASATRELGIFFPPGELKMERTLCLVKPDAVGDLVAIKQKITDLEFSILNEKQLTLSMVRAEEFFRDHKGMPYFSSLVRYMTSGPIVAIVLYRCQAVSC